MEQLIVGVDISRQSIDVAYFDSTQPIYLDRFDNSSDGFESLMQVIKPLAKQHQTDDVLIVLEPTGGYEQLLARFALENNFSVALPNPKQVRHWAKSCGRRAKTDGIDALNLAHYGATVQPSPWQPPDESISVLSSLLARRSDLEKMRQMETNRLDAVKHQAVVCNKTVSSLEASISFFDQQIDGINCAICQHFDDNPPLAKQQEQLKSVPGVGEKNVNFILTTFHRFHALTDGCGTAKQLTAFVGLDPVHNQSGNSIRPTPISKAGDSLTRRYLYLGALGGRRGDNPLREFYNRLIDRGKPKMVALIACARKILIWCWAIFKNNTLFDAKKLQKAPDFWSAPSFPGSQ